MTSQHLLAPLIGVVVVGVGAQWLAWRLKWPAIVLLALIGLAVGPLAQVLASTELLSGWFATQGFLPLVCVVRMPFRRLQVGYSPLLGRVSMGRWRGCQNGCNGAAIRRRFGRRRDR